MGLIWKENVIGLHKELNHITTILRVLIQILCQDLCISSRKLPFVFNRIGELLKNNKENVV